MKRPITHLRLPLLLALTICSAASTCAATLNVPSQYGNIQSAITAAQPGDVVLIADGTYTGAGNVNLDFGGKNITVASQNGAAKTIIDCQLNAARGVYFHHGEGAAAKLQGVTIKNGNAKALSPNSGGGIGIVSSSPTITGCVLANNVGSTGGGLYADTASHPQIANCVFTGNNAAEGAGMFAGDQVSVIGCTFTGNTNVDDAGGGAYFSLANGVGSTIFDCTFTGNTARSGAAVNTTVGGGIPGAITNCILFGDFGSELVSPSSVVVTFSDIQGSFVGTGNVSIDPQFARSFSLGATPADYGDQHLRATSPLIQAGTTARAPLTTLDGAARPVPPSIGAFEVGPALLPAAADSYVLSSAPTLTVGGFLGAAYLQFDLSSVALLSPGSSVKLRLNAGRPQAGTASLVVSGTGTNWTEAGLTFQNRPAIGLPQGFFNVTGGQAGAAYDVDITPYVKAQQALGVTQIGLALTQFGFGPPVSIDSKENPAGDGPQIVVTY